MIYLRVARGSGERFWAGSGPPNDAARPDRAPTSGRDKRGGYKERHDGSPESHIKLETFGRLMCGVGRLPRRNGAASRQTRLAHSEESG
jgi:hypothetical protein